MVSRSIRNLADTEHESWSPDPTSDQPGDLIPSSTTTAYLPNFNPETEEPGDLSRIVTTTVPGNHQQIEEFYLDGSLFRSYGALSPAMQYAYTVNATGELNSQSYVDGANLRETTTTHHTNYNKIGVENYE